MEKVRRWLLCGDVIIMRPLLYVPFLSKMVLLRLICRDSTIRFWGCLRISFASFDIRLSAEGRIGRRGRAGSALYYDKIKRL